jgi:hypothetical protein
MAAVARDGVYMSRDTGTNWSKVFTAAFTGDHIKQDMLSMSSNGSVVVTTRGYTQNTGTNWSNWAIPDTHGKYWVYGNTTNLYRTDDYTGPTYRYTFVPATFVATPLYLYGDATTPGSFRVTYSPADAGAVIQTYNAGTWANVAVLDGGGSQPPIAQNVNYAGYTASNLHLRALSIYNAGGMTNNGSILPAVSNSFSLGSLAKPWTHLYLATNSLYLGTNKVTVVAGAMKLNGADVGGGGSGSIKHTVAEKSDDYAVQIADSSKTIVLTGAAAKVFSLPSVAAGDVGTWYTFVKSGSGQLTIDAADSDVIIDSGVGDTVYNNTAAETYATLTLELVRETQWVATASFGTWTTTD